MITDCRHADITQTGTDTNEYTHTSADSYLENGGVHQIQEYPTLFWFKDTTNVQQVFELLFQNIFWRKCYDSKMQEILREKEKCRKAHVSATL